MAYTVKKIAAVSGVSVRTLHFYDEIGLLKPAYVGANGYRYYEEEQLLALQQILFFRELGFDLKEIQGLLRRGDFDKLKALKAHRSALLEKQGRVEQLIQTIDKTIEQLSGGRKMKAQEMFAGFDSKKQAEHEEYLIKRYGEGAREGIAQSKKKVEKWNKAEWEHTSKEWDAICKALTEALESERGAGEAHVQALVRRHFEWLNKFWTPNREAYAGHADLIVESELGDAYRAYHPRLAEFMAEAMKIFAARELQ